MDEQDQTAATAAAEPVDPGYVAPPEAHIPPRQAYVPRGFKWVGEAGVLPPVGMMARDYSPEELRGWLPKWSQRKRLRDRVPQAYEFEPPYADAVEEDED
jgi:hypothetical protein